MFRDVPINVDENSPVRFHIIDWFHGDVRDDDDHMYIIKLFGVTIEGHSIAVNVTGFQPFFYVTTKKERLSLCEIDSLEESIQDKLYGTYKDSFHISQVSKKSMWGFTNNTYRQYLKFSFTNISAMYYVKKILQKPIKINNFTTRVKFHESNIDAFLRFIHIQDIKPGGWVELSEFEVSVDHLDTKCQINLSCACEDVHPIESVGSVPSIVIMSFDIECTSSHGDFPVAIKTYRKTANELIQFHDTIKTERYYETIQPNLKSALCDIFTDGNILSRVTLKKKVNISMISDTIDKYFDDIYNILIGKSNAMNFMNKYEIEPTKLNQLEMELNNIFPEQKGDSIIQIGSTLHRYGEKECFYKHVVTLDTCEDIPGIDVVSCKSEKKLLKEWCKLIEKVDPDILTGYNILGFDFDYIHKRCVELGCDSTFLSCGRFNNHVSSFKEKVLASSALGENVLKYPNWEGRVIIDLMKVVQREYKLDSYKLDNVASHFISGKVVTMYNNNELELDSTTGINVNDYIKIDGIKCRVDSICKGNHITVDKTFSQTPKIWGLAKDDVTPKEIFECQQGTSKDRAKIAKYCVQDCSLCNMLIIKLEVIATNLGMANVCLVPLSYIFMRGQGIKIFSLVAKQCRDDNFIIPLITYDETLEENDGYEGAIVLDPIPGIYVDAPVSVMDYASLYPSSMISENISHDSIVLNDKYDNLDNMTYVDIVYDVFTGVGDKKKKVGETKCRYAQSEEKGILPRILLKLLSQRKSTRKQINYQTITTKDNDTYTGVVVSETDDIIILCDSKNMEVHISKSNILSRHDTHDDFTKAILDGLQLAYKITANSLYGQVGARTSPIYMKELAASTTATGRNLILKAKAFMEENYDAKVIYGDTDSIFVDFRIKDKYNVTEKSELLQKSIDMSVEASNRFKSLLKKPHDLEYEKTFYPFIILSKKKYVGNLYEFNVNKFKQKSMGIVLKRRDNANILKIIYGGIIDILLNKKNIQTAISYLQTSLDKLIRGEFDIQDLVITKTLRNTYKDPSKIAHKVLADRMKLRDPGSAPQTNDRIPYVYIEHDVKNKSLLQGDKIEHPEYIISNKVKIDYNFYITNQLMKPICQLLALALYDIPKYRLGIDYFEKKEKLLLMHHNEKRVKDKINDLKQQEVQKLLFDDILITLNNKRMGNVPITRFFEQIPH